MGMIEGLEELQKEQAKVDSEGGGRNFIPKVILYDGEIALLRFLTDADKMKVGYYHSVPAQSRGGRRFARDVFCAFDDGEDCAFCARFGDAVQSRRKLWNAWVYVYYVLHKSDNPNSTIGDKPWEQVIRGNETYYKENVNAVKLLQKGEGKGRYITSELLTFTRKYGTLCDRNYEWSRTGSKQQDTTYHLLPDDKLETPPELLKLAEALPDLDGVARGKIVQMPQSEDKDAVVPGATAQPSLKEKLETTAEPLIGEEL